MYLGEVSLCKDRLEKFFDSAKDLKITEIGEDCSDCGNILANIGPNVLKTEVQSTVEQLIELKDSVSEDEEQPPRTVFGKVHDNYNPVLGYPCNQCDHQEPSQWGLITHQESTHGEGVYSCDQCEYRATTQMGLKNHQQFEHEGIKYSCDECDYEGSTQWDLVKHQESKNLNEFIKGIFASFSR